MTEKVFTNVSVRAGVPDEKLGEAPRAYIVPAAAHDDLTQDEVHAWLADKV